MKCEITSRRIKQALSNAGMTAKELSEKSGVQEASISQYVNGYHKPSNISAGKIGKTLGVNPLWLMGFDEPMVKEATTNNHDDIEGIPHLTPREKAHLRNYRGLDDNNKERVEGLTASLLSAQQEAADYLIAAHARTDIETSEEMVNADLELLKKKARW